MATHPIFKICTLVEMMMGFSKYLRWWDKDHIQEGGKNTTEGEDIEVEGHIVV